MITCRLFQGPDFEDVIGKSDDTSEDDSDDVDDEEDTEGEAELTSSPVHQHRCDIYLTCPYICSVGFTC